MKTKKAQIKFGETFGVIIVVYIVLVFGISWYSGVFANQISKLDKKNNEELSYEKFSFIKNLNLLHKSNRGVISSNFDYINLQTFENFSKEQGERFLFETFGYGFIEVEILNEEEFFSDNGKKVSSIKNITLYNKTKDGTKNKLKTVHTFKTLIPIENETKTYPGILKVKFNYYS